ncbi:hypothetical protein [Haloferula sp. BvORR071]|uniref:hypothetical protein n=1 Tax=Haloferula sp. BvORR071 TaxID=1396141 RepID=UPI00054D0DD7|nr:hypothetical protein [Haloferula sp. BvORR071]
MAGKYEILDILAQDKSGIVFHAEERESGRSVVLRRFFPYGPEGGGLQEAERAAYMAALERVRELRHPTLRTILDGGCDPVDGMPFLVSEWVEGQRLGELLKSRPLSPGSTKALLTHALDASKELSAVFGEEAVWVETTPDSIVLPVAGENITFWVCPIKWLSTPENRGGLLPLAKLAERALHWRGKPVAGVGEGLGSWVKAVRENPFRWSLDEAIQALLEPLTMTSAPAMSMATATQPGGVPTVPMKAAQKQPKEKAAPKKKSPLPALLAVALITGAAAGGVIWFKKTGGKLPAFLSGKQEASATASEAAPEPAKSALDFGSSDMEKNAAAQKAAAATKGSALPASNIPSPSPTFKAHPDNQLTGTLSEIKEEGSGKDQVRYIMLRHEKTERWAVYAVSNNKKGFEMGELDKLRGKEVLFTGTFKDEGGKRGKVLQIDKMDVQQ